MPFYEYECSNCKFYSEVMQKITDEPLTKCPSCGKKTMVKLVSAPNFRLKGGGWYETDFKGDKENKRNLAAADPEESAAKSESKDEAKTAEPAKAETAKSETPAKVVSTAGASKPKPKAAPAKTGSGGRASKPASRAPVRVAAAKARPAASRSKTKPAAKKKGRR